MQHIQTPAAPAPSAPRKPEPTSTTSHSTSSQRNFSSDLNAATEGRGERERATGKSSDRLELRQKLGELEIKLEDGESVSDETWLDLISEIKSMTGEGEGGDDLRATLQQLLGEHDGDMAELLASLGLDEMASFTAALDGESLPEDIDQLLAAIEQLDSADSAQLQDKLAQLAGEQDGTQQLAQLQQQLTELMDSLQRALDSEQLSEQESEQALAALQKLQAVLGDGELDLTAEKTQLALQQLVQDLAELDLSQLEPASQQRLADFMQSVDEQLRQTYQDSSSWLSAREGSRGALGGNNLPPVAMALSEATQQLRAQLQNQLQASADGESEGLDVDEGLRRSLGDTLTASSQSASEQRGQWGSNSTSGQFNQALNQATGTNQARDAQMQQMERQPSAFEAARQAQQAVDILGSGAANTLRERISVMFNTRTQAAEMRLDPPDLGRLTIRLNMNQEQASVSFQVTTPQAREALEQSLPRLRELLQEQGIQLADADVSEQRSDQHAAGQGAAGQDSAGQGASGQQAGLAGSAEGIIEQGAELSRVEVDAPVGMADGRVDYFV